MIVNIPFLLQLLQLTTALPTFPYDLTLAIGENARAEGTFAFAWGKGACALGFCAKAIGDDARAVGHYAKASGAHSFALGERAKAAGLHSEAIGDASHAFGDHATALGDGTKAFGDNSLAVGKQSTAIGINAEAQGTRAVAVGSHSKAIGDLSIAQGPFAIVWGHNSKAEGLGVVAKGDSIHVKGFNEQYESADGTTAERLRKVQSEAGEIAVVQHTSSTTPEHMHSELGSDHHSAENAAEIVDHSRALPADRLFVPTDEQLAEDPALSMMEEGLPSNSHQSHDHPHEVGAVTKAGAIEGVTGHAADDKLAMMEEGQEPPSCVICFGDLDKGDVMNPIAKTKCSHEFHQSCLLQWMVQQMKGPAAPRSPKDPITTCPNCRQAPFSNQVLGEVKEEVDAVTKPRRVSQEYWYVDDDLP